MEKNSLYRFLTEQCKKKQIKIDTLIQSTGYSRSTLYRYMKGISPIGDEAREKLTALLRLDKREQQQFQSLISLSTVDTSLLRARERLDNFVFGKEAAFVTDIDFIYYNNEKYFRSIEEIWATVLQHAEGDAFSCEMRILGCMDRIFLSQLSSFLKQLFRLSARSTVEHLLSLDQSDYLQNTEIFTNIVTALPLAQYKNYTAFYSTGPLPNQNTLFGDTVLIKCTYTLDQAVQTEYYWLSLLRGKLSNCICFNDPYLYAFVLDNYTHIRKSYPTALCNSGGLELYSQSLLELALDTDAYLIKPNHCYDKIPFETYLAFKDRVYNEVGTVLTEMRGGGTSFEEAISHFIEHFRQRTALTFVNKHTDVYSKHGLLELARTGKITDHIAALPPFSKTEVRSMLAYIRDRNADPDDSYTLYITEEPIFENGLILAVFKGKGIIVEYSQNTQMGVTNNVLIESPELNAILIDYIENHVPDTHALSAESATQYLNMLIEEYT